MGNREGMYTCQYSPNCKTINFKMRCVPVPQATLVAVNTTIRTYIQLDFRQLCLKETNLKNFMHFFLSIRVQKSSFTEQLASKMTQFMLTVIISSVGRKLLDQIKPAAGQSAACQCDHYHNSNDASSLLCEDCNCSS